MTSRTDSDHPDESCDDVAASVDPTDRYLFELNKGGLPVDPSAKSVVAHASHLGLSAALVESLGRRARLMAWPKRRGRIVTQEELSVLMNIPEDDVRKRIHETMNYLRESGDRKKRDAAE